MTNSIRFTKMHGAGNDYIYVNTLAYPIADPERAAIQWSRFHTGIGSDGLVLIGKSDKADFSMRIFNADGSEAKMCGNASRCIGKYVYDHQLTDKTTVTLETLSGIKVIELKIVDGECVGATVDMGEPILSQPSQCATADGSLNNEEGVFVSMGNPHFVCFVKDSESHDVSGEGKKREFDPIFPERCNIEFATIRPDGSIRMRVWERGSGITMACGTGACATAVAACVKGLTGRQSDIEMDGGTLHIEWRESDNHIYMTGPAATVFEGELIERN